MRILQCLLVISSAVVVTSGYSVNRRAEPGECTFAVEPNEGDTCQSFSEWWGIPLDKILAFNPTLSCPTPDTTIPIQEWCLEKILPATTTTSSAAPTGTDSSTPSPTQANVIKTCTAWYLVVDGDQCGKIVNKFQTFTLTDFYTWNPDVGDTCAGLPLGAYVCVGVPGTPTRTAISTSTPTNDPSKPSPTQDNVTKDCTNWYKVVKGDGCQKIVNTYRTFALTDFYKWNPDVGSTCAFLPVDAYVCVGVPGTPTQAPSSSKAPSPTSTQPPTPTVTGSTPVPTQDGVNTSCNVWYYVAAGNVCTDITRMFKISLLNFYKWNPAVGTGCPNLIPDVYVCVGLK